MNKKKHILLYFMWNFEASNFEIRQDIFHFGRLLIYQALADKKYLSIGFHQTSHFFRFQGIANISSFVFHTFCLIYPASVRQKILSIGFHKTCHFFRFQGIANISSFVFHTFCLIYPDSVRRKFSKYWFPQDLSFFQISRNCKYFK